MNKLFKTTSFVFAVLVFAFLVNASFAQINTGNASSTTNVENNVNQTKIDLDCDCTPTPIPSTATPTPTTQVTPTPTLTPTPTPGDNNGGGDRPGDGRSSSPSQPTQAVLGLSATDSGNNIFVQFGQLFAALALSILGVKLFTKNA